MKVTVGPVFYNKSHTNGAGLSYYQKLLENTHTSCSSRRLGKQVELWSSQELPALRNWAAFVRVHFDSKLSFPGKKRGCLRERLIYSSRKVDMYVKIYNNSDFPFKRDGQVYSRLTEYERYDCLVLNSSVFDNVPQFLVKFQILNTHLWHILWVISNYIVFYNLELRWSLCKIEFLVVFRFTISRKYSICSEFLCALL